MAKVVALKNFAASALACSRSGLATTKHTKYTKMKIKSFVYSLLFALPLALMAAPETSILIIRPGDMKEAGKTAVGLARAMIKSTGGDMNVSAAALQLEENQTILKCSGETTILVAGRTIVGRDLTIALGDSHGLTVYYLNPNGIVVNPEGIQVGDKGFPRGDFKAAFEAWKPGEPSPFARAPADKGTAKP
jgi:hypothetical protein